MKLPSGYLSTVLALILVSVLPEGKAECPQDSDSCLTDSYDWWSNESCAGSVHKCTTWAKDMQRCCPVSCGTGALDEDECNALSSKGSCNYPNEAQCVVPLDGWKSSCGDSSDSVIMDMQEAKEFLELHNKYRGCVGTPPLQWSGELQCQTQRAQEDMSNKQQAFGHSPSYGLPIQAGENLADGLGVDTVDIWFTEYTDKGLGCPNYNEVGGLCKNGHYTAIVWKSTTKLGCSRSNGIIRCQYAESPPNMGCKSGACLFGSENVPYFAGTRENFDACDVDIFHIQAQVKRFIAYGVLSPDPEFAVHLGLGLGSDWVTISESAACASNSEGISSFLYSCGQSLQSCKFKCELQFGCQAIDYFSDTKYCHLYTTACTSPGSLSSGASSYKIGGSDGGGAVYEAGHTGTNSCKGEATKITDVEKCKQAAMQMDFLWNKEVNAGGFPGGCIHYMSKVWFNHNSGSSGQATTSLICKGKAGPTGPTKAPTWPVTVSEKYCHNYLDTPEPISDLSGCQSKCSEHAECIGVAYTKANNIPVYCYLCADDGLNGSAVMDFYRNPFKQTCQDVQPPDFFDYPTCAAQLANTDMCDRRRSGDVQDGICDKTCGVCSENLVTGKCTGNTGGTGDVTCPDTGNTQNKGYGVDGNDVGTCCEAPSGGGPSDGPSEGPNQSCDVNSEQQFWLKLNTDDYGSETNWFMIDNTTSPGIDITSNEQDSYKSNSFIEEFVCLKKDTCYTFQIHDSYGDGICCGNGNGYFNGLLDGVLIFTGGEFGDVDTYLIGCPTPQQPQPHPQPQPQSQPQLQPQSQPQPQPQICHPLGTNGRCGPSYGSSSCPKLKPFCNEDNGWCGASSAHQNAQPSTTYDYCIPSGPDLLGSCSYTDYMGHTCIEFRGEGQDITSMTERCAKENDSTFVVNHGCPAAADPQLAGWCAFPLNVYQHTAIVEASPMMNPAECADNKMECETDLFGMWIAAANCVFNEGPCPQDSDSCLSDSPGWYGLGNCAIAVEHCSTWAKDMHRCCPETCNTGALDEVACNALSGKGTCNYPNEAQCVLDNCIFNERIFETCAVLY